MLIRFSLCLGCVDLLCAPLDPVPYMILLGSKYD